jgi:hypothetical protein
VSSDKTPPKKATIVATVVGAVTAVLFGFAFEKGIPAYLTHRQLKARAEQWKLEPQAEKRMLSSIESQLSTFQAPEFREYFEKKVAAEKARRGSSDTSGFAAQIARFVVARGTARLPDEDLWSLHQLRTKTISASKRACPCSWNPATCTEGDIFDGLTRLSDDELKEWFRLTTQAARLEIKTDTPLPNLQSDFDEGLRAVIERLPESERARFVAVLRDDTSALPKSELCFASETVFREAQTLETNQRKRFIRAIAEVMARSPDQ